MIMLLHFKKNSNDGLYRALGRRKSVYFLIEIPEKREWCVVYYDRHLKAIFNFHRDRNVVLDWCDHLESLKIKRINKMFVFMIWQKIRRPMRLLMNVFGFIVMLFV